MGKSAPIVWGSTYVKGKTLSKKGVGIAGLGQTNQDQYEFDLVRLEVPFTVLGLLCDTTVVFLAYTHYYFVAKGIY